MNKERREEINKDVTKLMDFFLSFMLLSLRLIILVILITGATASFLLFLKLYPEMAMDIHKMFAPIGLSLFKIFKLSFIFLTLTITGWFIFNLFQEIIPRMEKRREERREKFLDDLSNKLKKKLKKK